MPDRTKWALLLLAGAIGLTPCAAFAQAPAAPPAPAAPLDPAQAASKAAYDRLDEAERKAIQNDLIWTGDFNGVAGGEFGRRTYDAILGFERRSGAAADGILTPPERAQLKQAADAARQGVRFAAITDPATGIRIGLPGAVLTQRIAVENGVVHRRADGLVSLQLQTLPAAASLQSLFDQMRQDGPGRKVTYRLFRPDWFVVSGEEGPRKFYTRIAQGPQGLRGYTFRYPAEQSAQFDRLMIAIANTFEPFPGTDVAANPARLPTTPPGAQQPTTTTLAQPTVRAAKARFAVSGIAAGAGKVLTSAIAMRACAGPTIDGQPIDTGSAIVSGDAMVLSASRQTRPLPPLKLDGAEASIFTLSFEDGERRSVVVSPGRMEGDGASRRISSALQAGPGGAPVVTSKGELVGLVREGPKAQRFVAGVAPSASYALASAADIAAALPKAGVAAAGGAGVAKLADAAAALVEIRCAGRV